MKKTLATAAILASLAFMPSAPAAQAQVNAELMVNIGRNVLSMEEYMLAIQYFNQAIKAKPFLSEPYFFRALAKMNLEDYQGAETDCTLSLERKKYNTEAYKLRGFCRLNLGLDSLAVADFDTGLKSEPEDRYFQYYKGIALLEMEKNAEADTVLTRLLKTYPKFDEAYSARARARMLNGDTTQAMLDVDRAVEVGKNNINNYMLRAQVHIDRKEWKAAAADMDDIIRLEPDNPAFYLNRAWLRYNSDSYAGAMEDYSTVLRLDPDNMAAVYNRALLKLEYLELEGASDDFSRILQKEPDNFLARYNRAIISMQLKRWKQAIADFTAISKKYPRFYPLYYGIAQAKEAMGDRDGAIRTALYAEDILRKYVDNPRKNPLDRPAIQRGVSNDYGARQKEGESEYDFMERFNQLMTVNEAPETQLTYEEQIKGRVQDRSGRVEPEPMFAISLWDGRTALRSASYYYKELDDLNRGHLLPTPLYITNARTAVSADEAERLFSVIDSYTSVIAAGNPRPIDYFGRGVTLAAVRNYEAALRDLDTAIRMNENFDAAYIARAAVRMEMSQTVSPEADGKGNKLPAASPAEIMDDLDRAIKLNPRLGYAWFNKGYLYYSVGDYTSALQAFSKALELNPDFAEGYFNRGLSYMAMGEKEKAFADLSRAGEMGILSAYKVLKTMK